MILLFIEFLGIEIFSRNYSVDRNGNLDLPEVGKISVKDKTLNEINDMLPILFEDYIFEPQIIASIISYRPITIFLGGEVRRPGLYLLKSKELKADSSNNLNLLKYSLNLNSNSSNKKNYNTEIPPKLFDGIQQGLGLTAYADISNITVIRQNSKKQGGGKIKAKIDLKALLVDGDQSQNIVLHDGDSVFIPKNKEYILDQLIEINRTNLTPDVIDVFVNGNVENSGRVSVIKNSSLIEAIATVGGNSANTGNIELLRLKRAGKTEKRIFRYDEYAAKGSYKNPILLNGDIIIVRNNILGKIDKTLENFSSPILSGYGLYKLFD